MKIAYFNGGLANQAFQYIFAHYYELSHPGELMYLDDSWFFLNRQHNGYELEPVFGIRPHMLSGCFTEDVWEYFLEEKKRGKHTATILHENGLPFSMIFEGKEHDGNFPGRTMTVPYDQYCPEILEKTGNIYYHGWWINKKWFWCYQDIFLKEFSFSELTDPKNLEYQERIRRSRSVSLHVRRGDFVTIGRAMDIKSCKEGIDLFVEKYSGNWELFVFSDDIPYCRENQEALGLSRFASVTYVEGNMGGKNYRDLQLMCQCKAMINSNSSFCFLANLLNRNI